MPPKHPPCTVLPPFQLTTRLQTLLCAAVTLPSSLAFDCGEPCILFSPKYTCMPVLTSKSAGQGSLFPGVLGGKRSDKRQILRCLLVCGYCRKVDFFLSLPQYLTPVSSSAKGGWTKQSVMQQTFRDLSLYPGLGGCIRHTVLELLLPAIEGLIMRWEVASSFQGDDGTNTGCSWDCGRQI